MWRKIRILLLLYVLLMVAVSAWLSRARSTDWGDTLWVTVYPINGDGSAASSKYVAGLSQSTFDPIAKFFAREGEHHGLALAEPVRMQLGTTLTESPPAPPQSRNVLSVALWSLRLRYWVFMADKGEDAAPTDIEIFVRYFDPEAHRSLAHSLGLQKGLIGVVNAFASTDYSGSNNVVITHELLHTVGAADKYDPSSGLPNYPNGFAEPSREPRYPQKFTEIMGGRRPVSSSEAVTPRSLKGVVVGDITAIEINWTR